jgi:hypothetical protein
MANCPNCNGPVRSGDSRCVNCGTSQTYNVSKNIWIPGETKSCWNCSGKGHTGGYYDSVFGGCHNENKKIWVTEKTCTTCKGKGSITTEGKNETQYETRYRW